MGDISVIKRNGEKKLLDLNKISRRINIQAEGLTVDTLKIIQATVNGLYDGVTTVELDELASRTAASHSLEHTDYSKLASNICVSRLHKETLSSFCQTMVDLHQAGYINEHIYSLVKPYSSVEVRKKIDEKIDYSRDYLFDYFGYKTLEKIYLLKIDGRVYERPQHMYMRVALTVTNTLEEAFEYYDMLSLHKVSSATPIMINSGTINQQLSSCVLIMNKGDGLEELCDTYKDVARTSADAAGIGLCISNIRSKESKISSSGGQAAGILKQLKIYNEIARTYNQQGRRKGSFAFYLEPWHLDIEDFIDCTKKHGNEESRARDIFTSLWICDIFMRRIKENGEWTLMCPNEILKTTGYILHETYGEDFERKYLELEEMVKSGEMLGRVVKAQDLWLKICSSQIESGLPYIAFKDNANKKTNHQNLGTVKQSNLCIEIFQYTDVDTTAICTLTSFPVHKFFNIEEQIYDYEELGRCVYAAVRNLNNVIEKNKYSTAEGERGGKSQRAIGLGIQGLADLFAILDIPFFCDEAKQYNKNIAETIYYYALKASMELSKERLSNLDEDSRSDIKNWTYEGFEGSPFSQGILQFDMWGLTSSDLSGMYDWDTLKKDIMAYGVSNSLLTANMPTASSANLIGCNECFEPFTNNTYVRRVLSGEYSIVNKYLIKDLEEINLWNETIRTELVYSNGSVEFLRKYANEENYDRILHIINKYKVVWEHSMRDVIDYCADRAPFIDQSQSMNLFMAEPSSGKLTSMHFYSWEKGLKTGIYYLRTKSVDGISKRLGVSKNKNPMIECVGCSS